MYYKVLDEAEISRDVIDTVYKLDSNDENMPLSSFVGIDQLIAPPAIGFISYLKLSGQFDIFARVLLYLAIFLFLLLASMFRYFYRIRFFVSWWAYTFPLCALTIAVITAFKYSGFIAFSWFATFMLTVSSLAVFLVLIKTLNALSNGTLCMPEE